jgi:hypothetical protein
MADHFPSPALVREMAAQWRGEAMTEQRAAEVAADLRRIVGHARAAAEGNDFDAEPAAFAAALQRLAARQP